MQSNPQLSFADRQFHRSLNLEQNVASRQLSPEGDISLPAVSTAGIGQAARGRRVVRTPMEKTIAEPQSDEVLLNVFRDARIHANISRQLCRPPGSAIGSTKDRWLTPTGRDIPPSGRRNWTHRQILYM